MNAIPFGLFLCKSSLNGIYKFLLRKRVNQIFQQFKAAILGPFSKGNLHFRHEILLRQQF
jgi:hypothetical protein